MISVARQDPLGDIATLESSEIELANRHGLVPLLAEQSDDLVLRAAAQRLAVRQTLMRAHLRRLLHLLDDAGIRAAVLKGPHLADGFYDNPAHRPFTDLDLLVEPQALNAALDVLATDPHIGDLPRQRPKADKRDLIVTDDSGVAFNLDLHWNLFAYSQLRGSALGFTDSAWESAEPMPDSPLGPTWELPRSAQVCFLSTHAVLDHRFRLILFRDLVEAAANGELDYRELAKDSTRWGLRSTTFMALWVSSRLLGAQVPEEVLDDLEPRSSALWYMKRTLPRQDIVRFDGHNIHPINLAAVTLNDSAISRAALAVRAPFAFPAWRRRVSTPTDSVANRPKVLIVAATDRRRGAEVFSERMRDGLIRKGWLAEAVSLTSSNNAETASLSPLTKVNSSEVGRLNLSVLRALHHKIRSYEPDVVVANGGATLRYSVLAKWGSQANLVYMAIGEPVYWINSRISRFINRFLLRRTDRVLSVSQATADQLTSLEPGLEGRIEVTFTGVPPEIFNIPNREHAGPFRIVMVGSLSPEKDPELALESLALLESSELRFVGDGPERGPLVARAEALGVSDQVQFVGQVEDVRPHLEWADALILTSLTEGLPGAILEGAAAGLPVVAVDVGGVSESVVDGETGFVVAERTARALAEPLTRLANDPELASSMGLAANEYIQRRFELDAILEDYAYQFEVASR